MQLPDVLKHHFSDGLYAKESFIPKGMKAPKHVHNYSHLSILASGKVSVETEDSCVIYDAPACIEIKAGIFHEIRAIEDSIWFCIHATDEKDESKVDQVLIERG